MIDIFLYSEKSSEIVDYVKQNKRWPNPGHSLSGTQLSDQWKVTELDKDRFPNHILASLKLPISLVESKTVLKIKGPKIPLDVIQFMANGWQSWSESPILSITDVLHRESFPERESFGDSHFYPYVQLPGVGHSWTFSYTYSTKNLNQLYGSLFEDVFSSVFEFDLNSRSLEIVVDVDGFLGGSLENRPTKTFMKSQNIGENEVLVGAWLLPKTTLFPQEELNPQDLADQVINYLNLMESFSIYPRAKMNKPVASLFGFTSWYHAYRNITEDYLKSCLHSYHQTYEELKSENTPMPASKPIFQIDDGYQKYIGDYDTPNEGFTKESISGISVESCRLDFSPGIWMAPFLVTPGSGSFKEQKKWLFPSSIEPFKLGDHPLWGGAFFGLDTEDSEFKNWTESKIAFTLEKGSFKFLKSDFMYASSVFPYGGLTRTQRGTLSSVWLETICEKKGVTLLTCGAILSQVMGRCHYARIGADVGETWENNEFGSIPSREKVSTRGTLVNTITRSPLNRTAFGNDPDVIILRDQSQELSRSQRESLWKTNATFGSLVFCSDPHFDKKSWQYEQYKKMLTQLKKSETSKIKAIWKKESCYHVAFSDSSLEEFTLDLA